jgi:hypothetical protein
LVAAVVGVVVAVPLAGVVVELAAAVPAVVTGVDVVEAALAGVDVAVGAPLVVTGMTGVVAWWSSSPWSPWSPWPDRLTSRSARNRSCRNA